MWGGTEWLLLYFRWKLLMHYGKRVLRINVGWGKRHRSQWLATHNLLTCMWHLPSFSKRNMVMFRMVAVITELVCTFLFTILSANFFSFVCCRWWHCGTEPLKCCSSQVTLHQWTCGASAVSLQRCSEEGENLAYLITWALYTYSQVFKKKTSILPHSFLKYFGPHLIVYKKNIVYS